MQELLSSFTPRELQVYELVITGKCNKEIAAQLGMTTRTVRFHVSNIFIKASVTSRIELICKALHVPMAIKSASHPETINNCSDTGHHASLR